MPPHGWAHTVDDPVPNRGVAVAFIIYLALYLPVLAVYGAITFFERRNFYIAARNARLLLVEIILNASLSTAVAMRQVLVDLGLAMPCFITNLAVLLGGGMYAISFAVRALHLCIIYDPSMRKRYHWYVSRRGSVIFMSGVFLATVAIWLPTNHLRLCHSICQVPNCLAGSNYYLTLTTSQVGVVFIFQGAVKIVTQNIRDQVGLRQELTRAAISCGLTLTTAFTIIILIDWGVLSGPVWGRVVTTVELMIFFFTFLWVHFLPSLRFGFHPVAVARKMRAHRHKVASSSDSMEGSIIARSSRGATLLSQVNSSHRALYTDPGLLRVFQTTCRNLLCEDSLLFLLAVLELQDMVDTGKESPSKVLGAAVGLLDKFVRPGSDYEINVESSMIKKLIKSVEAAATTHAVAGGTVVLVKGRRSSTGPAPPPPAAAATLEEGREQEQQDVVAAFYPAFREVQKMLFQNVLPKMEGSLEYQDARAQYLLTSE